MALTDQVERKPSAIQSAIQVRNMVRRAVLELEVSLNKLNPFAEVRDLPK